MLSILLTYILHEISKFGYGSQLSLISIMILLSLGSFAHMDKVELRSKETFLKTRYYYNKSELQFEYNIKA